MSIVCVLVKMLVYYVLAEEKPLWVHDVKLRDSFN